MGSYPCTCAVVCWLQAQDHDPSFRELLAARRTSRTQALSFVSDNSTHEGQIVVCFVVATRVSSPKFPKIDPALAILLCAIACSVANVCVSHTSYAAHDAPVSGRTTQQAAMSENPVGVVKHL